MPLMHNERLAHSESANRAINSKRLDGIDLLRGLSIFFVLMKGPSRFVVPLLAVRDRYPRATTDRHYEERARHSLRQRSWGYENNPSAVPGEVWLVDVVVWVRNDLSWCELYGS